VGLNSRAIIHLDLDAFFASVEVLEDPELAGKPLIVGGRPGGRGVVASASYAARSYGVHSAMPTARALVLCPKAIVLPPRHHLYREYSRRVMAILHESATLVEQTSVDEAFLDVTDHSASWESVVSFARLLQRQVKERTGLSASLGVATNKLVAKIASDRDKPGGLTIVPPGEEAAFLKDLPVRVLWGVGPVTAGKLAQMGLNTVGDLALIPEEELRAQFGRQGLAMAAQARGIDRRPLRTERDPKSVSQERTFRRDLAQMTALREQLQHMSHGVSRRLQEKDLVAATIALKLRYADFTTITRQAQLSVPTNDEQEIYRTVRTLLERVWRPGQPVRLLGVVGRKLSTPVGQLRLWSGQESGSGSLQDP
jgi:DNA polymerase-4